MFYKIKLIYNKIRLNYFANDYNLDGNDAVRYNSLENVNKLNREISHFEKNLHNDMKFIEKIYPLVQKNINHIEDKVIDVGCGSGILVSKLIKDTALNNAFGCDFSSEKIIKCKAVHNISNFFVHDVYNKFDEKYDVIVCTEVLEHLENPDDALINLLSSLNPRGKLIISVPDGRKDIFSGHINFWSPESFNIYINKLVNTSCGEYDLQFHYIDFKNVCVIQVLS